MERIARDTGYLRESTCLVRDLHGRVISYIIRDHRTPVLRGEAIDRPSPLAMIAAVIAAASIMATAAQVGSRFRGAGWPALLKHAYPNRDPLL